jgi:serine/threonine protein phosphatase PrpC
MTLSLRVVSHSEIGLVRKNNQDSGYASSQLLVVADGMGGAAAGDLASAVAIDSIRKIDVSTSNAQMLEVLAGALHKANDRIADLVEADYSLEGMGTTVTGVLFDGTQLALAHIGDSRAYLLHDAHLERLTHDHSWVQSLVDDGKISDHEAAVHPHRSLLLKVLNGQAANDPDLTMVKVEAGDRLLLCSDGLCGLVDDPMIEQAMLIPDLDDALHRLVSEALAEGGLDNITVILADVVDGSVAEPPVAVLGAAAEVAIPPVETRRRAGGDAVADEAEDTVITARPSPPPDPEQTVAVTGPASPEREVTDPDGVVDEERYLPQPPHRRRRIRPLVSVLVAALVTAAVLGSAYAWTRTQYYVGAADDKVAIFRGLSEGIPGLTLSHVFEPQPLAVSALPPYYQERVRANIDVVGLAAARDTVAKLTQAAERCAIVSRTSPTASTGPSVATSPRTQPAATAKPSASAGSTSPKPTPRPSASATSSGVPSAEPDC